MPWILVGRANPFCQWVPLARYARIEQAAQAAERMKATGRFYAVHVRAA